MPFCSSCGKELDVDWNACPNCGFAMNSAIRLETPKNLTSHTQHTIPPVQQVVMMQQDPKSMGIALLLNFIWPGAGHLYLDHSRGLLYAMFSLACLLTAWLIIPILPLFIIWFGCLATTSSIHKKYLQKRNSPQNI
jgi:TM2 domain-containing membrane protein YozV/ribosomal protein L37E